MKYFILTLLFITMPAFSQEGLSGHNTKQPIVIDADSLEVMQQDKMATFVGNVVATQGSMTLNSDKMTVYYNEGGQRNGINKIEASGNVLLTTPSETAKSQYGVYDTVQETVFLVEDVVLTRDKNILKGSKLIFNIATGQSKVVRDENERVRGLFVPE